ncbi:hypothetical protein UCDDA912_g03786 [Diaporthe ampelina]|uniref:Uncharacterized protein n=1 Tax=Diaporthe ampelina TaxID=1214573 RepID=A0A0G2FPH4_9PEZI|nr:hypothetical protein UCDDA912_g03786 [Diaporthe ampelina]
MEDAYPQADQAQKPRRLRQKDLEELRDKHQSGEDKLIPIWKKAGPNEPHTSFVDAFSRTALATFSPQWKKQLDLHPEYCVAEGPYRGVFKLILDWIKLCIEEGNDVKFPDIEEPETNPKEDAKEYKRQHQLHILLDVIAAANYLQIPEASLQTGLKKRAAGYARKHIIDLRLVKRIYSSEVGDHLTSDLREVAAISIFEAWWTHKLDDPEFDEYVSELEQMRVDVPKLDEDLHEQFIKKKEFIAGKREERKRARDAEFSAAPVDNGFDNPHGPTDGGWDSVDGAGDAGDGWNQAAAVVTNEGAADWEKTTEEKPSWGAASDSIW